MIEEPSKNQVLLPEEVEQRVKKMLVDLTHDYNSDEFIDIFYFIIQHLPTESKLGIISQCRLDLMIEKLIHKWCENKDIQEFGGGI